MPDVVCLESILGLYKALQDVLRSFCQVYITAILYSPHHFFNYYVILVVYHQHHHACMVSFISDHTQTELHRCRKSHRGRCRRRGVKMGEESIALEIELQKVCLDDLELLSIFGCLVATTRKHGCIWMRQSQF